MPVTTRSQLSSGHDDVSNQRQSPRIRTIPEESPLLHDPHHRLKEKMKALTLHYEQQKHQSLARKSLTRDSIQPNVNLFRSKKKHDTEETIAVIKENRLRNAPIPKPVKLEIPNDDSKENLPCTDQIGGFSCPVKNTDTNVVRRLSMGVSIPQSEYRVRHDLKIGGELDTISEDSDLGSRILVFVRLRPMSMKEKEVGSRCCVRIVNKRDIYLTEFASENDYLRLKRLRGRHFTFDASFPENSNQQDVYTTTTADLVEAVLQGRNGSVFCYGATGAGKTYTMLGTVENPGVMVLAIKDLFAKIRQRSYDGNHEVHLSYLEVYNETVRDLLSPGRPLVLREDKQGIVAAGLTHYRAYSTDEVMALLQQGNQNRTTEPTRINETSSRSHAILQVVAEFRVKDAGGSIVNTVGKLSLIDLAGSERALATDQRTLRSLEGANINRSLLALSSCINALVEGKKHIPYRNSKLTQLLKDSLGGACNTVMIANITPSNICFGETQNTLHWANRAKQIRTKTCMANEEIIGMPETETDKAKLLLELQKENRELRMQLARQQQKLISLQAQSLAANSSPMPSRLLSPTDSRKPNQRHKPKSLLLSANCCNTPDAKNNARDEATQELKQMIKTLENEMEKMKKDYELQLKRKDDFIREISQNNSVLEDKKPTTQRNLNRKGGAEWRKRVEKPSVIGELKSPSHRFLSPANNTVKKRSFWDISPSVTAINGRKTRSHIAPSATVQAPSMLLQPGFARRKLEPPKR